MNSATPRLRWSAVRDCTRKAIYDSERPAERERTLSEQRTLARGHSVGREYLVQLCYENGWKLWAESGPHFWIPPDLRPKDQASADVLAEYRVKWKYGTGHADAWLQSTDTILEVLSSASGEGMRRGKELQAALYMRETGAHNLQVTVVNPTDLSEERTTVTRESAAWPGLLAEVEARISALDRYYETGELPERVCRKPSEARGHWCLHAEHCFAGWEPEPLELLTDLQAADDASRHFVLKLREKELRSRLSVLEEERKEVEASLAERVEPGTWQAGDYEITRSHRTRKSFKFSLAERDERFPTALLDEFTSMSEYDVWTTKPLEGKEEGIG